MQMQEYTNYHAPDQIKSESGYLANCYGDCDNDLIVPVFILPTSTLHIIRDFLSQEKRVGVNGEKYNSHHKEL